MRWQRRIPCAFECSRYFHPLEGSFFVLQAPLFARTIHARTRARARKATRSERDDAPMFETQVADLLQRTAGEYIRVRFSSSSSSSLSKCLVLSTCIPHALFRPPLSLSPPPSAIDGALTGELPIQSLFHVPLSQGIDKTELKISVLSGEVNLQADCS